MSNYIPRYSKKRERLARVQSDLVRLLTERAVERVRQAKIRALKAQRTHLAERQTHQPELAEIDGRMRAWECMPREAILEFVRSHASEASDKTVQHLGAGE